MRKVTLIRWHMAHSHILIIYSFFDVFLTKPLAFLTVRWKINDLGRTPTCNPQIRSLVPYPLGHKSTLILVFRFISRPSTFRCQKYWIHPYRRYTNKYSKFLIIEHGLSIEECCSALAPYQGNVFALAQYKGKVFLLFLAQYKEKFFLHWLIRGKSFCIDSVYGESHLN